MVQASTLGLETPSRLEGAQEAQLMRYGLWRRAAWLLWSFSWVIACAPMALLSQDFCERLYYRFIYEAIRYSRSAAMTKWAQWASVRLDLLPAALCGLLAKLQSEAPTHTFAHTLAELKGAGLLPGQAGEAAGAPTGAAGVVALTDVDERPIASGSIAQMHLASCNGHRVAVKVRHPRVGEELVLDFELMRRCAGALHEWVPALRWLNAPATVSQFEAAMSGQCNLEEEAENLRRFNSNFRRKSAWTAFPRVVFATPGVLVESFEDGELASDLADRWRNQEPPADVRADLDFIISRGEDCYLQMLLVDNFMHADLHPGNMMFRKEGPQGGRQVVVLDAGMAAHLTAPERQNFIGLLQAIGDGNGSLIADRILSFSVRQSCRDTGAFVAEVCELCAEHCRGYGTGLDIGRVVRGVMQLMHRHGVNMDGNYATLIANMLCLEGLTKDLNPNFNVIDAAYPFLRAHQLIGDIPFQRMFVVAAGLLPDAFWELCFRLTLYGAKHGEHLKQFQI